MADIFDIVADPTRRDILRVLLNASGDLASGEISVSEIVRELELSQPTVSKHLKVLRDNALVRVREEGQHRYYKLDPGPLEAIEDWLIPFLGSSFELDSVLGGGLADETRDFASSVGKAIADTSHRVTTAVQRVSPRTWRRD